MSGPTLSQSPDGSEFGVSDLRWSPDGQRLLLSSIDGVVSIGRGSSSSAIVYANGTNPAGLNLEWAIARSDLAAGAQVTMQASDSARAWIATLAPLTP